MSKNTTNTEDDEVWAELDFNNTALQSLLDNPLEEADSSRLRDGTQHQGFDNNMGESWIYPNNLPCRTYQMSIVQAALYRNTLVVLPTGLGKTFIAAVVMYNFYRWYPRGKVIFMAPTRPLVNQQIEACQNIMPFPKKDTVELTGKLPRLKRMEMWKTKRVFFATPQVVQSDIFGGRQQGVDSVDESSFQEADQATKTDFPFDLVKLIVIDEAHKAKGKYAYTEVTQALARKTKYFRVLALSATPGRTVEDVAEVCRNLFISHLEVRWDSSIDVLPYVHKRTMETVVIPMGDKIQQIREQLLDIIDPYLRQLTEVLSGSLANINRNFLLYEQKRFRDLSYHQGRHPRHSAITTNFAICISLYHALELLERHGLRAFLNSFEEDEDGKSKFVLQMDRRLNDLVENLKKEMGRNPFDFSAAPMTNGKIAEIPKDLDFGHPKFEKTRECLLKHFENNKDSRAIVFCEYRESVMLIYRMLLQHVPLLRPRCFVGQGGTGSLRALTQKQQIQIMNDFRSGKSNILVATSIAEEGFDVGEVELIVCFDISTSNPIRFVQRIGRTGRKKNGYVIMMVTEGREQQLLREVLSNKDQINKKLLSSSVVQRALYKHAPRLVPTEFKPKCVQTYIKPPSDDEDAGSSTKAKKLAKTTNNSKRTGQDLRKFFQNKPKELDKEDMEFFEDGTQITQVKPGLQTQQNIVNKLDKMKNLFKDLQSSIATQTQKAVKKTPTKLKNTQASVKDFFIDMSKKTKANESLNNHQKFFKDSTSDTIDFKNSLNDTIDLCEDENDNHQTDIALEEPPTKVDLTNIALETSSTKELDAERLSKLKKFLKTTITTKEVKKRANIKDLSCHLKSKELSKEMKVLLLTERPGFIKDILEQMQVLGALCDDTPDDCTKEEQSIREIYQIILKLFGGPANVEKILDKMELEKYKQKCLDSDSETEEEDPEEINNFHKKLNHLFKGLGDGKKYDNYDWIQQRFKETNFYKDQMKSEVQANVQASMIYENFAADENTLNHFDDFSITESKYCSQWQEFNKTDIAFESTPLQAATKGPLCRKQPVKKTSLLTKLEEAKGEYEMEEQKNNTLDTSGSSRQIQNMLLKLENQLKESSLNEMKPASSQDNEQQILEKESMILPATNSEDEYDLLMAADKAELEISQNQSKEDNKYSISLQESRKTSNSTELKNDAKYDFNLAASSLNSTPELDLSSFSNVKKPEIPPTTSAPQKSASNSGLQYELDIDMEAFMEPFPEEQELLKAMQPNFRRGSFKENLTKATTSDFVRESPDLFAEEHIRSTIKKPIVCRKPSLAAKLAANINLKKCQSDVHPASSLTSPHKPLFSTQNPKEQLDSPSSRLPTDKEKYEKSPSLFDMYLKSTKGKGKLPKSLANSSTLTSSVRNTNSVNIPLKDSPVIPASPENVSIIMLRNRKGIASKRKIFDSDSEHEEDSRQVKDLSAINLKANGDDNDDSDLEEVPATQRPKETSIFHQRRKKRRFNSFIMQEADVSSTAKSEDEGEHTIGQYAYDSVVVSSDEDDPDQASTSHMQAMYLQSLKSPQQRRNTFKIPAPRVYNDDSRIFSQAVIPNETYSQYLPDSFVVLEEDSVLNENADVSLCPLERAEKILEERRKAKRQNLLAQKCHKSKPKTKTKLQTIIDNSSEDDDFE